MGRLAPLQDRHGRPATALSQASGKLADLRQAISSATTHEELQARVQQLFGPNAGLSPSERRTPIGELRPMLLARAEQASRQLMQRIEAQAAIKPDQLLKESLRIAISAVAYAIGFAFLAGVLPRGKAEAPQRRQVVDEDYFDQLAR
jgi:hypothetical protein